MDIEKRETGNERNPTDQASYSQPQSNASEPKKQTSVAPSNHWPSDERPRLASQAEDMASLLKADASDPALSTRLHNFAKDVELLEERAAKYQAVIQRLQVQLQNMSEASNPKVTEQLREEVRSLKVKNDTLQSFIKTNAGRQQKEEAQKTVDLEPGWVAVGGCLDKTGETPSMMLYPDNPLMKRIDELQKTNAKLFAANKDWHTKWEQLRHSKQNEQEELVSRLKLAEEEKERLNSELASLRSKGQEEKEKADNSKLKEKEAQIALLKQQLTVFMQDFENEKREKRLFQEKLQRKERDQEKVKAELEQRVRGLNQEARSKEEKLRGSRGEIQRLHFRVAQLLDEVKKERRRADNASAAATTPPYVAQQRRSPSPQSMVSLVYPSSAGAPMSTMYASHFAIGQRHGPEELPGAWTCPDCTYINYPDRTVCDICGLTKTLDGEIGLNEVGELQSRGSSPKGVGANVPDAFNDVEIDFAY